MHFADIGGKRLGFSDGGVKWQSGRPHVLLLHGAGGDHTVWALQTRSLASHGYNVAAIDLPGHGASEDDPSLESIENLAERVSALADDLGLAEFCVAGHSMGACVALTLAARSEVTALALVGAGLAMPVNDQLLDDTLHHKERAEAFIVAFGHGSGAHYGVNEAPGLWTLGAARALLERCPEGVLHRDFAACGAWQGTDYAPKVAAPTLVLSGAEDRMTPARAGKALADAIESAQFVVLPDSGHMMMAESPTAVTRTLRSFFDRVTS